MMKKLFLIGVCVVLMGCSSNTQAQPQAAATTVTSAEEALTPAEEETEELEAPAQEASGDVLSEEVQGLKYSVLAGYDPASGNRETNKMYDNGEATFGVSFSTDGVGNAEESREIQNDVMAHLGYELGEITDVSYAGMNGLRVPYQGTSNRTGDFSAVNIILFGEGGDYTVSFIDYSDTGRMADFETMLQSLSK